jgi:hypothetical protein
VSEQYLVLATSGCPRNKTQIAVIAGDFPGADRTPESLRLNLPFCAVMPPPGQITSQIENVES